MASDEDDNLLQLRCMITNEDGAVTIDICLVFNPNRDMGRQLAHAWGMLPGYFCAPGNHIQLRVDFHRAYDKGNWAIVPCSMTLKEIASTAFMLSRSTEPCPFYLESFPQMERTYHFVHFCGYPDPIIAIRSNDDYPRSYVIHQSPFENFPTIQSSVHPYFVIADVAQKVLRQRKEKLRVNDQSSAIQERLDLCVVIYNQWLSLKNTPEPTTLEPPLPDSFPSTKATILQPDSRSPAQARQGPIKAVKKRVLSDSEEDIPLSASSAVSRSRIKRG